MLNPVAQYPTFAKYFSRGAVLCTCSHLVVLAIIRQGGDLTGGAGQTLWLQARAQEMSVGEFGFVGLALPGGMK